MAKFTKSEQAKVKSMIRNIKQKRRYYMDDYKTITGQATNLTKSQPIVIKPHLPKERKQFATEQEMYDYMYELEQMSQRDYMSTLTTERKNQFVKGLDYIYGTAINDELMSEIESLTDKQFRQLIYSPELPPLHWKYMQGMGLLLMYDTNFIEPPEIEELAEQIHNIKS